MLHGQQVLGQDSFAVAQYLDEDLVQLSIVIITAVLSDLEGRGRTLLDTSYLVDILFWECSVNTAYADHHGGFVHQHTTHLHVGVLAFPTLSTGEQQPSWYQLAVLDTHSAQICQPHHVVHAGLGSKLHREQTGIAEQLATVVHTGHE